MMKLHVRLGMILALLLILSGVARMVTAAPSTPVIEATWTPIVTLPVGSGDGQIGYRFDVEGAGDLGPQALAAGPDGTIYVLDSVQQRVHVIANGAVRNTIAMPFTI